MSVSGTGRNVQFRCIDKAPFATAADSCASIGARLCRVDEVVAGVSRGTQCANSRRIWTSTACRGSSLAPAPSSVCGNKLAYIEGPQGTIGSLELKPIPIDGYARDPRKNLADFYRYGKPIAVSANFPYENLLVPNTVSIFKIAYQGAVYMGIVSNRGMSGGSHQCFTAEFLSSDSNVSLGEVIVKDDPGEFGSMIWRKSPDATGLLGRQSWCHLPPRTDGMIFGPINGCFQIKFTYQGNFNLRLVSYKGSSGSDLFDSVIYQHPQSMSSAKMTIQATLDMCRCSSSVDASKLRTAPADMNRRCNQAATVSHTCVGGSVFGGTGDEFCRCPVGKTCDVTATDGPTCVTSSRERPLVTISASGSKKMCVQSAMADEVKVCVRKTSGEQLALPVLSFGPAKRYCNERLQSDDDVCEGGANGSGRGQWCTCPTGTTCTGQCDGGVPACVDVAYFPNSGQQMKVSVKANSEGVCAVLQTISGVGGAVTETNVNVHKLETTGPKCCPRHFSYVAEVDGCISRRDGRLREFHPCNPGTSQSTCAVEKETDMARLTWSNDGATCTGSSRSVSTQQSTFMMVTVTYSYVNVSDSAAKDHVDRLAAVAQGNLPSGASPTLLGIVVGVQQQRMDANGRPVSGSFVTVISPGGTVVIGGTTNELSPRSDGGERLGLVLGLTLGLFGLFAIACVVLVVVVFVMKTFKTSGLQAGPSHRVKAYFRDASMDSQSPVGAQPSTISVVNA